MPIIPLEELKKDKGIRVRLLKHELKFRTTLGLFCPDEIDEGTLLLMSAIDPGADFKSILDIGCGYGPIGIALAKSFPDAEVDLIDKDFVAVDYANKNIALNGIDAKKAKSYLSNGFSHVPAGKKYDLIISNLPAKVNKEFFWILFGEAFEHLPVGGTFLVVAIKQLEPMLKKSFDAVFGNSEIVSQNKVYSVVRTVRTK